MGSPEGCHILTPMSSTEPSSRTRLLYVLLAPMDGYNGATKHVLGLSGGVAGHGIDVRLLCPEDGIGAAIEGREVISVAPGAKRGASAVTRMWRRAARDPWTRHPKTVMYTRAHHFGFVPALVAARARRPLVVELNGMPEFVGIEHECDAVVTPIGDRVRRRAAVAVMKASYARLLSGGALFFVNNQEAVEHLVERRGVAPEKVHLVPLGFDPEHARPRDQTESRLQLELPREGRIIVHVGPLLHYKGADTLLRAFARIRAEDASLVFVGDGEFRPRLESLAHEAGIAARVRFVGETPFHETPIWVAAADLAVGLSKITPLWGCCPTKVIEYVACGVPVLTNAMATTRALANEMPITLVDDTEDVEQLSAALQDLMDRDLRTCRVEKLPPGVREYSWDSIGRRAAVIFSSLANGSGGPRERSE